jgi:HTH-type transcriptional regulator/antitoxin HipB
LCPDICRERIGVAEQQVQRWEANDYSGVGLDRLQSIADALGVQIHETITYSSRIIPQCC